MSDSLSGLQSALSSGNLLSTIAHPNIVNPLAAYKDALGTASSVYQLRDMQAKEAAGQEFQKSIDPVTGMPNQAALMRGLAGNPTAALAAQQSAQTGQQLDHNTFVTNMARDDAVSGAITGLYGQYGGKVPQQAINDEIDRVAPTVGWNAQQIAQNKAQFGADPVANGQALLRSKILHLQAQQQWMAATPQVGLSRQPQGDVATITPPITSPNFGQVTPTGSGVAAGVSPTTDADIVSLNRPGLPAQQMTRGQARTILQSNPELAPYNPQVGVGGQQQPAAPGQQQPAPVKTPPAQTPPAQTPPAQPQLGTAARADAAGTATGASPPPATFGTSGAPGQAAVLEERGKAGGQLAQQLEVQGQDAQTKTQPLLAGMLTDLQGTGMTGFGSTLVGRIRQLATSMGVAPPVLDLTNKQAAMEAMHKLFAQYEAQQLGSLGSSPSDSRQSLASAGSPSMLNSPEGNRQIIRNLQGGNDALDTMYRAWMASNTRATNPQNFAQWRTAFTAPVTSGPLAGARFDPTTFAVNRMDPAEQHTYLINLQKASPADFAQFKKDWALAQKENWVGQIGARQ